MSSFWKYFCFPRRRHKTNNEKTPKRKRKDRAQPGSLIDQTDIGYTEVPDTVRTFPEYQRDDSIQKLVDGQRPKKRRRVQDIFPPVQNSDLPVEHRSSSGKYRAAYWDSQNTFSADYQRSFDLDQREPKRFGVSRGISHAAGRDVNNQSECGENMYGYVPKVVQHVYASTALEGRKLDDFFGNCRRDSWLKMFASVDKVRSDSGTIVSNLPLKTIPNTHRQSNTEIDLNLIDLNSSEERAHLQNCWQSNNNKPINSNSRNPPTGYMANIFSTHVTNPSSSIPEINISNYKRDHVLLSNARSTQNSPHNYFNAGIRHDRHLTETPNCNSYDSSAPRPSNRLFETLAKTGDVLY